MALLSNFEIQVNVWGYSVEGMGDISTRISEKGYWTTAREWDDPELLDFVSLSGDRVPDYYALWWVCEHERRKDRDDE